MLPHISDRRQKLGRTPYEASLQPLPIDDVVDRALELTVSEGRHVRPPTAGLDQIDDGTGD